MESMLYGSLIGILLLMQAMIIYECIRMKSHVSTESSGLRTAMADMGTLLDEAIDYIADLSSPRKVASMPIPGTGESIQSMLLTGLMNRMLMPPEHGSTTQQEERQVLQEYPTQTETETEPS